MKILATLNGFYTCAIQQAFLSLLSQRYDELAVAIVTTASPQKEHNRFAQKAKVDFQQMGFSNIVFLDVEYESPALLDEVDVIYINGGNPFHLLHCLRESGAQAVLQRLTSKPVVLVGVSAGAVVLGPSIDIVHAFTPHMNERHMTDFTALGLLDEIIFPHYDREDIFAHKAGTTIEARLQQFEARAAVNVTRLNDADYVIRDAKATSVW